MLWQWLLTQHPRSETVYTNMLQKAGVSVPKYARTVKDEGNPVVRFHSFVFGKLNNFINCANICAY